LAHLTYKYTHHLHTHLYISATYRSYQKFVSTLCFVTTLTSSQNLVRFTAFQPFSIDIILTYAATKNYYNYSPGPICFPARYIKVIHSVHLL